ncbi:hypothetical protein HZB78_03595 [Candidatus Collierbacteria bacterium]|nr:hypothetical protein [Candidatus Collierbacteria bacterium]
MKLSSVYIREIDSQIQQCLMQNPKASVRSLAQLLNHDKNFIAKRLRKVRGERLNRFKDRFITEEMAVLEDVANWVSRIGAEIANNERLNPRHRLMALQVVFASQLNCFDRKIANGLLLNNTPTTDNSLSFKNIVRTIHQKIQSCQTNI